MHMKYSDHAGPEEMFISEEFAWCKGNDTP